MLATWAGSLLALTGVVAALPTFEQIPLLADVEAGTRALSQAVAHPGTSEAQSTTSSSDGYVATYGASHLSEWCALSKERFLKAVKNDEAQDWIIVTGNEAGDLDSLVAAIALAYDIAHAKHERQHAVALLQVENSAIDLRPENKLALERSGMERGHKDLLVLEELPYEPKKIGTMIKGLMLVDHNRPLSYWGDTPILGIVDHHRDRGVNETADPRVIQPAGSCSSLVTNVILDHKHAHGPIPLSLGNLILYTIAIDTKGLEKAQAVDRSAAQAILEHSHYADQDLSSLMHDLGKEMKKAKKDLDHLDVWQLIQRDWKGDVVLNSTIPVHLGFASIPYSFQNMIDKTANKTVENFFEIEDDWAHYNKVDISVILTSFKDEEGNKEREIILTVKSQHRIDDAEAERLFTDAKRDIETSDELQLRPWGDGKDLGQWTHAWIHNREDGGRKIVRPLVEKAVQRW